MSGAFDLNLDGAPCARLGCHHRRDEHITRGGTHRFECQAEGCRCGEFVIGGVEDFSRFADSSAPPPAHDPAGRQVIHGIDASGWSGNLDVPAIAASEAFVYHQATDGVGTVDKLLMPRTNALRAAGIAGRLGAYHFLRVRHGHAQDADEQCKQFLDAQANAGCTLPPWLDVELGEPGSGNRAATKDEVRAAVELWWGTYQACSPYDGTCPVYSSPGEMKAMGLDLVPGVELHPLALAEYVLPPGQAPTSLPLAPKLPAPFTSWAFWQYAGNVPRYGGVVDLVLFNGTLEQLQSM